MRPPRSTLPNCNHSVTITGMAAATLRHRETVFRAIADPTRRQILHLLRARPLAVGEIAGHFRTSRPAISKHLRILRSARLVITHANGTARICALNAEPLRLVDEWLDDYAVFWTQSLRSLKRHVEEHR